MRSIFLSCVLLVMTATAALAQQPGRPLRLRPAVGLAVGMSARLDESRGNHGNSLVSGIYEIPLSSDGWLRIEASRTSLPIGSNEAHFSRISVGAGGLTSPAAPVSPYFGLGYGIYRASFEHGVASPWHGGVHFYGGAELHVSERLRVDAELGVHLLRSEDLDPGLLVPGEAVIRMKFGF